MSDSDDQAGDYGYDMAHEVKSYLATRRIHRSNPPGATGVRRPLDPDADFGYDEAHGH